MAIRIRNATAADATEIAGVLASAFASYRSLYSPRGYATTVASARAVEQRMLEGPVWVAIDAGRIAGTASLVLDGATGYLRGMAVDPSYEGRGIGRSLLGAAEAHAVAEGVTRLWLYSTPFLRVAIGLYRSAGYVEIPGGESDLHGTPLIGMEKRIGP